MITPSLIIAILWVFAATGTALLPMRFQYVPGVALLVGAPFLIFWLGYDFGWWVAVAASFGFVSMFRNPLRYLFAKARGQNPERPR